MRTIHADPRAVLLKTADFIERHPERFRFTSIGVPRDDSPGYTTACALGWMAYFMHQAERKHCRNALTCGWLRLRQSRDGFYAPLYLLAAAKPRLERRFGLAQNLSRWLVYDSLFYADLQNALNKRYNRRALSWTTDAGRCAEALRAYADKHFPADAAPKALPDNVQAIFDPDKEAA